MKRVIPEPESGVVTTLQSDDDSDKANLLRGQSHFSVPVYSKSQFKYQAVWHRVCFRIKVRKALSLVNDEIVLYGTSSDFLDMNDNYKQNVNEILWKKQNKQEDFRTYAQTAVTVIPWHVIHPESLFTNIWSSSLVLLLIYTACVMPVRVAFYDVVFFDAWTIADICIDGLFTFDILINCLTAFEKRDGGIEVSHKEILYAYAKSWLVFDVLACLPFSFIEYGTRSDSEQTDNKSRYNNLIRLTRVPRLYKLLRILRIAKAFKRLNSSSFISKFADYLRANSRED